MDQPNNVAEELAAALNGHQITDEDGQAEVETETTEEKPAAPEAQTTETEPAKPEAPKAPQAEDDDAEAEDESGKRYIPKSRFDKVYGKLKDAERKLAQQPAPAQQPAAPQAPVQPTQPVDKTEALEVELLKGKLPQFDPDSDQYSQELDELGAEIYRANPGITRIDAARRAVNYAKKMAMQVAEVRAEARTVKAVQSDQGITNRVIDRSTSQPDFDSMSAAETEKWLRDHGEW